MIRTIFLVFVFIFLGEAKAARSHDTFLQGPEQLGEIRSLSGRVIGMQRDAKQTCFIVLADYKNRAIKGLGGAGRFFVCEAGLGATKVGNVWAGRVRQTGTRMHRVGQQMRVIPLFSKN